MHVGTVNTKIIIDSFTKKFLSRTLLLRCSACVLYFSILLKRSWIANEYEIPKLMKLIYRNCISISFQYFILNSSIRQFFCNLYFQLYGKYDSLREFNTFSYFMDLAHFLFYEDYF